jgi:hypothetical protein
MAVLIEAISVVVRADALLRAFKGDWTAFAQTVPNATLCADGELARIGFMSPAAVKQFVDSLEARGLTFLSGGNAVDIVVVDQQRGPMMACDWVQFGHIPFDGNDRKMIAACRLRGSTLSSVVCPDGWLFEESLSSSFGFVPGGSADRSLRFLRHENGLDVFWSELAGKEVFIARDPPKHK